MTDPSSAHAITIDPTQGRVTIRFGGRIVADTRRALTLREGRLPPVQYVPREDADMSLLQPTTHRSHCPFKGDASYFTVAAGDSTAENAVWSYEAPLPAAAAIASYLAFYPDRVEITLE